MSDLTPAQQDAMKALAPHSGAEVFVQTHSTDFYLHREALAASVCFVEKRTLSNLEKKGLVRIVYARFPIAKIEVMGGDAQTGTE